MSLNLVILFNKLLQTNYYVQSEYTSNEILYQSLFHHFAEADLDKLSELVGLDESALLELQPQPQTTSDLLQDLPSSVSNWETSGSCYVDLSSSHYR